MTIPGLILLLQNQLVTLNGLMLTAITQGDVARVIEIQEQIDETQATLDQLQTLAG